MKLDNQIVDLKIKFKSLNDQLLNSENLENKEIIKINKELSKLEPIISIVNEIERIQNEIIGYKELLENEKDEELRDIVKKELPEYEILLEDNNKELMLALLPKDDADEKNAILEIRAGTGGDEAALFAGDLYRMYERYSSFKSWKFTPMLKSETGLKGIKEAVIEIKGDSVFKLLKNESGVHRVQRIPETESGGRIHTSAATVAVLPEAEEFDVDLKDSELRIDVYRSGGAGGQSVNTTDSAVRITHLPTKIVVQCQNERSQHKNKNTCMNMLRARLYDFEMKKREKESQTVESSKSEIGWGHQIRSYVLHPYRMVKDNRTNFESSNPDKILDGEIDDFLESSLYKVT